MYVSNGSALGAATTALGGVGSAIGLGSGSVSSAAGSAAGSTAGAAAGSAGALPFTGVNAFFLFLTALTLLLMGSALVRIAQTVRAPKL